LRSTRKPWRRVLTLRLRRITRAEATRLLQTTDGQALLSPRHGAVAITDALLTQGGRLVVGITCALCHATLDPHTLQVVEGCMNNDFNGGLMLALATNFAAYLRRIWGTPQWPRSTPTRRIRSAR
jgi:hypothetical protein